MVFTTHIFLFVFLPLVLVLYFALPRRGRNALLTAMSFVFYGWWRPDFVLLMLFSAFVDYHAGARVARLEDDRKKRRWVFLSCLVNLSLLGFFKYADFGIGSANALLESLGYEPIELLNIVLPVGISFYTFQSMSYTIDIYRGASRPQLTDLLDFACYVSLFPQLVAGPIIRYRDIADQLQLKRNHTAGPRPAPAPCCSRWARAKKVLLAEPSLRSPTRAFALAMGLVRSRPGSASWPTPSRSTSTSRATPIWPWDSASCSGSSSR